MSDLLRAPRRRPATILSRSMPAPYPAHRRARHRGAVRRSDRAGEPILHVRSQRSFAASFAAFGRRARRSACHCAVVARYSSSPPRVAALRRNSREIVDGDRPSCRAISRTPHGHARPRSPPARQTTSTAPTTGPNRLMASRHFRNHGCPPPATRRRPRRLLARPPTRDPRPKPPAMLPPRHRRSPRRPHRSSPHTARPTSLRHSHRNS